jgi:hypothetical protein
MDVDPNLLAVLKPFGHGHAYKFGLPISVLVRVFKACCGVSSFLVAILAGSRIFGLLAAGQSLRAPGPDRVFSFWFICLSPPVLAQSLLVGPA